MEQKTKRKYYLGLDLGTNSVGWAVTDETYHLLRAKGKNLWGVRLFDEAQTSAERRTYRVARRRRQREVARLGLLREIFAPEIDKIDPGFFARLDDSKFHMEERAEGNKQPFALFADNYTDQDYYKQYPTIFHLRKELIESDDAHDVRMVYLALANMFKHRGHFLNAALDSRDDEGSFGEMYRTLLDKAEELELALPAPVDMNLLEQILGEKGKSRTQILESAAEALSIDKKQKTAYQILSLMCGLNVKLIDVFGENVIDEEHKKLSLSFRDSNYEEKADEIETIIGEDNFELILAIKSLHDKGLLASIMKGHDYLSQARVESYKIHQRDLRQLKSVVKKYDSKAYRKLFRVMEEGNYSAYVGSVNSYDKVIRRINKGRGKEELYKTIRNILKNFPQDDEDVQEILQKIDAGVFLPKQLTDMNGVIPNQVHKKEMKAILKKAENYLPFLKEKDETNLTVSEKILQIFSFQIPYYIGPLGQKYKDKEGYNVWCERKAGGRIYPWNFEEKVDNARTAEKFIERMLRHCTYLSNENALPKQSLLYQKFEVLNELNNLRVHGEKLPEEVRQNLYKELFQKGKKVSFNQLKNYLIVNNLMEEKGEGVISGIDGGFHSSLSSLGKFTGALGERAFYDENQEMIEDIIFWGTIYGNDKKFLKERIREKYSEEVISNQELKRILGFKFEGWGRISESFLTMEGVSKEDGAVRSLIGAMWETGDNMMELLSDRYTYTEVLKERTNNAEKPLKEWEIDDLDEFYLSAPVKRMVWQTLSIIDELETVIGCAPERIFVEMAREEGNKGERKESRKQKLSNLYKAIRDEEKIWTKETENEPESTFRSKKLYLYYLQMGKCMYTGERIELSDLMNDNLYDIDHIYPRHFVKDDSIENNLVLVRKEKNAHKSDEFPIESEIRKDMYSTWKIMLDKGFMTQEKFRRLTRKEPFTEEEKANFINRQLVETRQGTKAVTQILQRAFQESKTEIVFAKAGNVSDFRNKYKLYKVRCVNDLHHAQDAYLNIVVGNVYYVKFTKNPLNFIREAQKAPNSLQNRYNMDKIFDWDVERNGERAWMASTKEDNEGTKETGTIVTVRKVLADHSPLVTRMCVEKHGSITGKATIWNAQKAAEGSGYIPVKMKDTRLCDVTKYGGLTSVSVAGYTLVEYCLKGKKIRSLESLPSYLGRSETLTEEQMLHYFEKVLCEENKGKTIENLRICRKLIPQKSLIKYNGMYYYLGGKTNKKICVNNAVQLCIDQNQMNYLKKVEKAVTSDYYEEKDSNGQPVLISERNKDIYRLFAEKFTHTLYKNLVGAVKKCVLESEETFCILSVKDQCYVLMQLFLNLQAGSTADLRLIGGVEQAGAYTINKDITKAQEVVLICQSVTGLYQREIDLLTV
ncbi:MAG: type II CRISPR RNA-guided endonuclease Cas9 [Lachnospiraceae bacterium]|nr:type II CRISPR RNA-guided endonuclease Cas9 [Lachnospiraceae bacterium]